MKQNILFLCFLASTHTTFTFDTQRELIAIDKKTLQQHSVILLESRNNCKLLLEKHNELLEKNIEQTNIIKNQNDCIKKLHQIINSNKVSADIRHTWLNQNLENLNTVYEHNGRLLAVYNEITPKLYNLTKENTQLRHANAILRNENKALKKCPYTLSCTIL